MGYFPISVYRVNSRLTQVAGVIRLPTDTARDMGLQLHHSVAPEVPAYLIGPHRIRQVILNLVGNVIKFTEKGSVTVDVRAGDQSSLFRSNPTSNLNTFWFTARHD